jgi:hypothetical protein
MADEMARVLMLLRNLPLITAVADPRLPSARVLLGGQGVTLTDNDTRQSLSVKGGGAPFTVIIANAPNGGRGRPSSVSGRGVQFGLLSVRPAFGHLGSWYYATDTSALYLDSGTAWLQVNAVPVVNTQLLEGDAMLQTTLLITPAQIINNDIPPLVSDSSGRALIPRSIDILPLLGPFPFGGTLDLIWKIGGVTGQSVLSSFTADLLNLGRTPNENSGVFPKSLESYWDGSVPVPQSVVGGHPLSLILNPSYTSAPVNAVLTSSINTAGTGYNGGDYIALVSPSNADAIIQVDSVDGSGGVTGYHFPDLDYAITVGSHSWWNFRGKGYTASSTAAQDATTGGGTGFILNVGDVYDGEGGAFLQVTALYTLE